MGAVGFISVLFPFLLPLGLVKVDEETREPVTNILNFLITIIIIIIIILTSPHLTSPQLRTEDGLCIPCEFGEAGELVGRIDRGHPVR